MDAMYVAFLIRALASCCASIERQARWAPHPRRGSPRRTPPQLLANCWRVRTRPDRASARSAMPSMLARANWESAASRACSRLPSSTATPLAIRLHSSTGAGRERVSLRAPLSGAQPASPFEPEANRPTHPRTNSVSRRDPTTNPIRGIQIMNMIELNRSLVQLRLSGMAAVMETRLHQAQPRTWCPST